MLFLNISGTIPLAFDNVVDIKNLNAELLNDINEMRMREQEGRKVDLKIGDIFLKYAEYFKIYTSYCANQASIQTTIENLAKVRKIYSVMNLTEKQSLCSIPG